MRNTRKKVTGSRASVALLITAASMGAVSVCFAGSIADTTARMLTRAARAARPAPSSLNLHPSAPAILNLARPRAFEQLSGERNHASELAAVDSERGGLNLHAAFPIKWENTPANLNPKIVNLARNFRHNGLPIVHLWGSGRNLLALGLNPHGKPGLYFTQNMD